MSDYFGFSYLSGGRFFDVQEWSSTEYVALTMGGDQTVFGVNFAGDEDWRLPTVKDLRSIVDYTRAPV